MRPNCRSISACITHHLKGTAFRVCVRTTPRVILPNELLDSVENSVERLCPSTSTTAKVCRHPLAVVDVDGQSTTATNPLSLARVLFTHSPSCAVQEFVSPLIRTPKSPYPPRTRESSEVVPHLPLSHETRIPIVYRHSLARQSHLACPVHGAERMGPGQWPRQALPQRCGPIWRSNRSIGRCLRRAGRNTSGGGHRTGSRRRASPAA